MVLTPSTDSSSVSLDNCDREPIHIPGMVQQHGALLALGADGSLRWVSGNAAAVLGVEVPTPGAAAAAFDPELAAALQEQLSDLGNDPGPHRGEVALAGRTFDAILHRSGACIVAEFEPRDAADDAGAFALQAHRSLEQLRRQRSLQALLDTAVHQVRRLTGFDRVMAYRFRHDASGDIAAEAKVDTLDAFLGRRYPASDIPAQARRMYVANTLRLIADVGSQPVPLLGAEAEPLDMTHSVLRSVSPIHIEYLTNMGVGASMSVSIVVNGQLWGMLACHHMGAKRVPYSVRLTCDVLAQLLASSVQSLLAAEHGQQVARAAELRTRMASDALLGEDLFAALSPFAVELSQGFDAQAAVVAYGGRLAPHGELDADTGAKLLEWLASPAVDARSGIFANHDRARLPADLGASLDGLCGILALHFDDLQEGWLVLLRQEQIETVDWGGRPEKKYVNGPLGPRLTPRGSFDVWREIVRGTSVPWSTSDLEAARLLRDELARITSARHAEMNRAKDQLIAVLGHDLRNPLQTISMSAHILKRGADGAAVGNRIQNASSRMQRLISQVLDMSRLQAGLGLGFHPQAMELGALVNEIMDEDEVAHPGSQYVRDFPARLPIDGDADRIAQMAGNLLSNARHHGKPGQPVTVRLQQEGDFALLSVSNHADAIDPELLPHLFTPFKRQSLGNRYNRGGLGLGLYIAREIALGHGGSLAYGFGDGQVTFTARLARQQGR